MAVASVADVQRRLERPLEQYEIDVIPTLLDDVEAIIVSRLPRILKDIRTDEQLRKNLIRVEAYAVIRVIRNPDGLQQESEGSYSYSQSARVASGLLSVTDDEWLLLGFRAGAYSIALKVNDGSGLPWYEQPPWAFQFGDTEYD